MSYEAMILADSVPVGFTARLVTMQVTFPRFILAEFNTHRVFSRNSASSRAIPVERRIKQVKENPFVPEAFGKNRPGMQATEELDERDGSKARDTWLRARDAAVEQADRLLDFGVHKQHANRLLEPFAWHTVVVSSTYWENFFALRDHPAAQPEMQITARAMRRVYEASVPTILSRGQWHLPYVTERDYDEYGPTDLLPKISVVRCAAVSYERQDVERSVDQVTKRYEEMRRMGHWSPFEHQAKYSYGDERSNFAPPWYQHRKMFENEACFIP